jgi:hypothetical protein
LHVTELAERAARPAQLSSSGRFRPTDIREAGFIVISSSYPNLPAFFVGKFGKTSPSKPNKHK